MWRQSTHRRLHGWKRYKISNLSDQPCMQLGQYSKTMPVCRSVLRSDAEPEQSTYR
jgi:hypothetical protein